ncbi:hypothetical protein PR048_031470 [Dryococelus australis]|uniref:Uncharacterized protein n=1 Tax=Dryococelus australis TaxID=614101 RepID=A0ABQ9G5D4_9NEOP|nr:hypothetical protein PR048_031470 [Dryococelus australis]
MGIDFDDELHKLNDVLDNDESFSRSRSIEYDNKISEEGLLYLAGFVAHRFRSTCPGLRVTMNENSDASRKNSFIQKISGGGLMILNDTFLQTINIADKCFISFH